MRNDKGTNNKLLKKIVFSNDCYRAKLSILLRAQLNGFDSTDLDRDNVIATLRHVRDNYCRSIDGSIDYDVCAPCVPIAAGRL